MTQALTPTAPGRIQAKPRARRGNQHETFMPTWITDALRLGWYLAEVRGRAWPLGQRPTSQPLPPDPENPLPLRPQRSQTESLRQALDTLVYLSERLQVSTPSGLGQPPGSTDPFPPRVEQLLDPSGPPRTDLAANTATGAPEDSPAWPRIAELIYDWDSAIQDQLAARADILACAYLLGRGLSECYWALAPDDRQVCADGTTPNAGSWSFLFSDARRRELSRMAGRLGPYLNALTPVAVSGSLEAWGRVAAEPAWRSEPTAPATLYEQLRRWYQLLILGQDPSTLIHPAALLHGKRTTLRLARAFWPQLLTTTLSLAVVAAFLLLLTTDTGGAFTQTLLALIGTIGLSAATLAAKAKNATQSLLARLRQRAHSDLVAMEVTRVPLHPRDNRTHTTSSRSVTHREVERAVAASPLAAPFRTTG